MTGWRMGYIAAPPPVIEAAVKIHQYSMLCAPIMAQIAAIEALKSGHGPMEKMKDAYFQRRNVIVAGFNELGLDCRMPDGAFYVLPCIESSGLSGEDFAWRLLEKYRVALVPGSAFGACGKTHIRCSYATSLEDIKEALNRIGQLLKEL